MHNNEIYRQRRNDAREENIRFQPVIMVLREKRLECHCGALATFVNADLDDNGYIHSVCVNCHDCYCKNGEE